MNLDWLETFLAVVDRGGFTAASHRLHRSQSRVSAHIAALERDLGVRLFDRARRPTTLTPAGEAFVRHAREIVGAMASARSTVGSVRDLDGDTLTLITTPCIGSGSFPGVVTRLTAEFPSARIDLAEQSWRDVEHQFVADGAALAVLPVLAASSVEGLRHRVVWRERLLVVVDEAHELAAHGGALPLDRAVRHPLVVCRASVDGEPEALRMLAVRGVPAQARVTVDSPEALVSLVRSGAGVGILNAVALQALDLSGLAVLDVQDGALRRDVAVYWSDLLLRTERGRGLHRAVLATSVPRAADPVCTSWHGLAGAGS